LSSDLGQKVRLSGSFRAGTLGKDIGDPALLANLDHLRRVGLKCMKTVQSPAYRCLRKPKMCFFSLACSVLYLVLDRFIQAKPKNLEVSEYCVGQRSGHSGRCWLPF
jgi:hypothetical protein